MNTKLIWEVLFDFFLMHNAIEKLIKKKISFVCLPGVALTSESQENKSDIWILDLKTPRLQSIRRHTGSPWFQLNNFPSGWLHLFQLGSFISQYFCCVPSRMPPPCDLSVLSYKGSVALTWLFSHSTPPSFLQQEPSAQTLYFATAFFASQLLYFFFPNA